MYEYKCGQIIVKKRFPESKYVIISKEIKETILAPGNELNRNIKYDVIAFEYAKKILEQASVGKCNVFSCIVLTQDDIEDNYLLDVKSSWS